MNDVTLNVNANIVSVRLTDDVQFDITLEGESNSVPMCVITRSGIQYKKVPLLLFMLSHCGLTKSIQNMCSYLADPSTVQRLTDSLDEIYKYEYTTFIHEQDDVKSYRMALVRMLCGYRRTEPSSPENLVKITTEISLHITQGRDLTEEFDEIIRNNKDGLEKIGIRDASIDTFVSHMMDRLECYLHRKHRRVK